MAKISEGVLGAFIGKVGPVTGYIRNGQNIVRTARSRSDGKITLARSAQRAKIKVCNEFTKAFSGTGFFKRTFPAAEKGGTGYNRACSAIMNLAVTGSYPNTSLNYSKVLISQGPLPPPENAKVSKPGDGKLYFTWDDNSNDGTAQPDDRAILIAFFPEVKQAIYSIGDNCRSDEEAVLDVGIMKNFAAETWIGFLSADEKLASCSCYAGKTGVAK